MKNNSPIIGLLLGNIGSIDCIRSSEEYQKQMDCVVKAEEDLLTELRNNIQILNLFKKYDEEVGKLHLQEIYDFYEYAFKFGLLLGMYIKE